MKKRVAILTGGESSERSVALASAENIYSLLEERYSIEVFDFPKEIDRFLQERSNIYVAIPMFHGRGGEDGKVQGFLHTLHVPFIFSDVEAHALAMDKARTKRMVADAGLKTAPFSVIWKGEPMMFQHPCVIKPLDGGSSIGVTIARDTATFEQGVEEAFKQSTQILIEEFIQGDEFTVAVIEQRGETEVLPVIQIKSKKSFFDYESKYDAALVDEICPAPIDKELARRLQEAACIAHEVIGARHITRSDFIVDREGTIWFLEINTIPGQTKNSLVPKALRAQGIDFGELVSTWIEEAGEKHSFQT